MARNKYHIDIYSHDVKEEDNSGYSPSKTAAKEGNKDVSGMASLKGATNFARVAALGAPIVQVFKWQLSLVGRNTGNSDLQEKINATTRLAMQGVGIVTAMAVNPIAGAGALAAVGLNYLKQVEQFNYDRRMDSIALAEARMRGGPSLNRSRAEG